MKCEKCGADIPEGVKSCPKCNPQEAVKPAADAAEKGKDDTEFDKQYSEMFEGGKKEEPKYQIDEELRRKREARYDSSFSNMTDDEKIKALEAARIARKEKRERKEQKKENGGFAFLKSKGSAAKPEKTAKESGGPTETDSAAEKPERSRAKYKPSPKAGIIAGCVIAVLVIAIVIAAVNMATKVTTELPETATVYTKDNVLYSAYDGKEIKLSDSFIASKYVEPVATEAPSDTEDEDAEDTEKAAEPDFYPVKEKELITNTDDGAGVYFIDNADLNSNTGALNYSKNGVKNGTVKIDDGVYYDIAVSSDGTGVLYLKDTDRYGAGGTLEYWSSVTGAAVELAKNVLPGHYLFDLNANCVLYINEYNGEYNVGDLYLTSLTKGEVTDTRKVDSDVYDVYGANTSGNAAVYSKGFNDETGCFDLYLQKEDGEIVSIVEGSRCEPVLQSTADGMYAGGTYEDYYQSLYYVSLLNGEKEKISGNLTEIVGMSGDELAVVFRKANAEGTAFDYYYAHRDAAEGQLLAENITVLDDEEHKRVSQFEISDDFTKAAYIEGYDVATESGALFVVSITNGVVGSDKKISDTAYSCDITPDGQTVRFADSYDTTWNLVTLNAYTADKNTVLAEEVGAGAFTFDQNGSYIVYAKNYSLETRTGDVYCVNNDGKTREVVKDVSSYGLKSNGYIVYYNNQSGGSSFELFCAREDGKREKSVDKDVTEVVSY